MVFQTYMTFFFPKHKSSQQKSLGSSVGLVILVFIYYFSIC